MSNSAPLPRGCVEACPGCRYRKLSVTESDKRKQGWSSQCLSPFPVSPIRAPAQRLGYRRKAQLHAQRIGAGWEFGLLKRSGRDYDLIPIPDCPLHAPELNQHLKDLRSLIPPDAPLVYVLVSGALITLVFKCPPTPAWREWAKSIESALAATGVAGLQINWNPSAGRRAISSRHQEKIFGPDFLEESDIAYGPLSFRQQIPELENEAQELAENFLAESESKQIADLYCGTGATLLRWAKRGWRAVGVELSGEAVRAAERNAPHALIFKGRVEHRVPQLKEQFPNGNFLLFTNPPRGGHGEEVLSWILEASPDRIAYLSCNQRSLAHDLAALSEEYELRQVQPFDFFPQTDHVEALALLLKRKRR